MIRTLFMVFLLSLSIGMMKAHAQDFQIFGEPYVGYGFGSQTSYGTLGTGGTYNNSAGNVRASGVGARAGIEMDQIVFGGLDFSYLPISSSSPNSYSYFTSDTQKMTRLGLVAGVYVPVLPIRVWVGYNFLDKLSGTAASGFAGAGSNASMSGYSFKFGVGYNFVSDLYINAEYILSYFNSFNVAGKSTAMSSSAEAYKANLLLLSVSMPLKFNLGK